MVGSDLMDKLKIYKSLCSKEPNPQPIVLIGAGETTVHVTGNGKGGIDF